MKEVTFQKIIFKILDQTNILILLLGTFFLMVGATKGVKLGNFSFLVEETIWRIVISLAGVTFISFAFIFQFKSNSSVAKKEVKHSKSFLHEWNTQAFRDRLVTAKEICMISVSNYSLLHSDLSELFVNMFEKGGKYRCIYLDPDSDALSMVASRCTGVEKDINHLKNQYKMSIDSLKSFSKKLIRKNNIQVRLTTYMNGYVLTILDSKLPNAVAYVTINGYGQHYTERPSLTIYKEHDPQRYKFFEDTFENLWEESNDRKVEL